MGLQTNLCLWVSNTFNYLNSQEANLDCIRSVLDENSILISHYQPREKHVCIGVCV